MKHIIIENYIHRQMKLYAVAKGITMKNLVAGLWISFINKQKGDELPEHEIVKDKFQRPDV